MREAYRHGRHSAWLPGEDLETMLAENIDALRLRLHIAPPVIYQKTRRRVQDDETEP